MKGFLLAVAVAVLFAPASRAEEPDHEVHQQLRGILRVVEDAMNNGRYDAMLPVLDERIAATSVTQDVLSSRGDVSKYFATWFGADGYMKRMKMTLVADALTELSPDKNWGLVRGLADEHYEAKDGYKFDFRTRWTALVARGDDGQWRLRAIHFGTNHLDNPVLARVRTELTRIAYLAGAGALVLGAVLGFLLGRRGARKASA